MVLDQTSLGEAFRLLRVCAPEDAPARPEPGQFYLLRLPGRDDPLLGRPLAAAGLDDGSLHFLYRIVGRGTALLGALGAGDRLLLKGPCGHGFPAPSGRRLLLVAGGAGAAPILYGRSVYANTPGVRMIFGAPDREWESFARYCTSLHRDTDLWSDDGSFGSEGTALDGLEKIFEAGDEVWACGSAAMLRGLGVCCEGASRIMVSLESRMACGIGGCMGCSIPTKSGRARVCVEGPVFPWEEVFGHEDNR